MGGGLYYSEENGIYQSRAAASASMELVFRGEYSDDTVVAVHRRSGFTDMAEEYGADQVIFAHGQSRSRDVSTEWSIDWFPAINWFGTLKYPQKIGHFHRLTYY